MKCQPPSSKKYQKILSNMIRNNILIIHCSHQQQYGKKKITENVYERTGILILISDVMGEICASLMSSFFKTVIILQIGHSLI